MGKLPLVIVFGALLALTCGQVTDKIDPEFHSSVSPNSTTTTGPITIVPTSSEPTKPTKPTTSTTTTTVTPPPTTKTTTLTPPTTPTTKPTTPAPTPPPTKPTTPAPTPKPEPPKPPKNIDPPIVEWRVNYTAPSNGSCIFAQMAIQIEMPYLTNDNKTWHAYLDITQNATAVGKCDNYNENLVLTWDNNSVTFNFEKKENQTWYSIDKIDVTIMKDPKNFPNLKENSSQSVHLVFAQDLFNTTEKMSYKCAKVQTFNLTMDNSNETLAFIHMSHLQLQAFSNKNATGFADAVDCEPAGTPDIVPIAAGCALAALIIVVLVAYLVGRKRSQARGYLSM